MLLRPFSVLLIVPTDDLGLFRDVVPQSDKSQLMELSWDMVWRSVKQQNRERIGHHKPHKQVLMGHTHLYMY